jgi:hypothetical protein
LSTDSAPRPCFAICIRSLHAHNRASVCCGNPLCARSRAREAAPSAARRIRDELWAGPPPIFFLPRWPRLGAERRRFLFWEFGWRRRGAVPEQLCGRPANRWDGNSMDHAPLSIGGWEPSGASNPARALTSAGDFVFMDRRRRWRQRPIRLCRRRRFAPTALRRLRGYRVAADGCQCLRSALFGAAIRDEWTEQEVSDLLLWPMKASDAPYPSWEVPARAYGSPSLFRWWAGEEPE